LLAKNPVLFSLVSERLLTKGNNMDVTKRQMDIVDAAIRIIARQGFRELTTKNLAKELKLTEAALYRHFNSKHDLVQTILSYFAEVSAQVLENIRDKGLSPWQKVERFVMNRFEIFCRQPDLGSVIFSEELFRNDPALMEHMRVIMHSHRNEVITYIKEAQSEGQINPNCDPDQIFRIVVGSMRFTVTQWVLSGRGFDLVLEGQKLIKALNTLIEVNK